MKIWTGKWNCPSRVCMEYPSRGWLELHGRMVWVRHNLSLSKQSEWCPCHALHWSFPLSPSDSMAGLGGQGIINSLLPRVVWQCLATSGRVVGRVWCKLWCYKTSTKHQSNIGSPSQKLEGKIIGFLVIPRATLCHFQFSTRSGVAPHAMLWGMRPYGWQVEV